LGENRTSTRKARVIDSSEIRLCQDFFADKIDNRENFEDNLSKMVLCLNKTNIANSFKVVVLLTLN